MKIKSLPFLLILLGLGGSTPAQNNARMLSTPNAQTGTSYTFVAADTTRVTTFNNAGAVAVTLPNGATVGFGAGTMLSVVNLGAGTVTITCSSCTINGAATLILSQNQGTDIYGGSGSPAVNYVAVASPAGANIAILNAPNAFTGNNTILASSTGNIAARNFSADHVVYVSGSGNDSNDGLSWGTAKLTVQAAITAATNTGANAGTVYIPCGSFTGPTTFYNGLSLISTCSNLVPGVGATIFSYSPAGTNLSISNVTGMYWHNIALNMNGSASAGGGFIVGNAFTGNTFDGFAIYGCGFQSDCITGLTTTAGSSNNAVNNLFSNFVIGPNGNSWANCISLKGTLSSFTDNRFMNGICQGNVGSGLILRANSDTNYFQNFWVFNFGSAQANSGCLVINDQSPTSDVDADGSEMIGFGCLGPFTNTIRAGQSTGHVIDINSLANGYASLGGTQTNQYRFIIPGPSASTPDLTVGGKLTATAAALGFSQGATNSGPGDATFARTTTSGVVFLGTDGGNIARSSNAIGPVCGGGTTGCSINIPELAAPAGIALQDIIWPDSTAHTWKVNNNAGGSDVLFNGQKGICTMAAGTCTISFASPNNFAVAPLCFATWNGTGTLTGIVKAVGASGSPSTCVVTSSVNTDTAVMNVLAVANPN